MLEVLRLFLARAHAQLSVTRLVVTFHGSCNKKVLLITQLLSHGVLLHSWWSFMLGQFRFFAEIWITKLVKSVCWARLIRYIEHAVVRTQYFVVR